MIEDSCSTLGMPHFGCMCQLGQFHQKLPHSMLSNRIQVVSISLSAYEDFVSTICLVVFILTQHT